MQSQPEQQLPSSDKPAACHPSIRKWILLRGLLLGLLVAGWWIMFAPDSMMESQLKIILGIIAGLVATGSYLYNLRQTLCPERCCGRNEASGTPKP